jgi:putative glutamine amidotransferase
MAMAPVIGITCSTIVVEEMRGVTRFALSNYYVRCIMQAGALPLLLPNVAPESAAAYLARIDGLILSGGLDVDPLYFGQEPLPDLGEVDQVRDAFELELVKGAHHAGIPVFAICRGVQVMNVAFGGTLLQHIPAQVKGALKHEQAAVRKDAVSHSLEIVEGTRLHAIAGETRTRVNSFHHQAVDRVAEDFVVSARTLDGVIEGLEDPAHPFCIGVQWHPERRPKDPLTRGLFRSHVEAARVAAQAGVGRGS